MTLEEQVTEKLTACKQRLSTAESCTGGLMAARLTDLPGTSEIFVGGVVSYHNEVKENLLGVRNATLETFGAVSEETAIEMAEGVRKALNTEYGVGITGIAGPGGATPEKPVGLVYIAVAGPEGGEVTRNVFDGDRTAVREQSVDKAFHMLLELMR